MIFSKCVYGIRQYQRMKADILTFQPTQTQTGIVQVDSEAHREDRGHCCERNSTREILRVAPQRLKRKLLSRLIVFPHN